MRLRGKHGLTRTLRLSLLVTALTLVLAAGVAQAGGASFEPGAPGLGDPYFPLDGNGGYDVKHYLLEITYDPATDVLTGKATISARAKQNLSQFNLDFVGLTVESIKVGGGAAEWERKGGELTVIPHSGIPKGDSFTTVVRYEGVPEPIEDALGTSGVIPTDDGVVIVGQPHVAATWFPANDHPLDKAAYTFRIMVPSRAGSDRQRQTGAQANEQWVDDLDVERKRADGVIPCDDSRWRVRPPRLPDQRSSLLGRDRPEALRSPRAANRGPVRHLPEGRPLVQAPDAHDLRAGGWRDTLVCDYARYRARMGLRLRRSPHSGRERLDDASRPERAYEQKHGFLVPLLASAAPFPRALPNRQRGRDMLAGRLVREVAGGEREERRVGAVEGRPLQVRGEQCQGVDQLRE